MPDVQEAVAKLCMAWWAADAPRREQLMPQTLPYLLVKALTTGAASPGLCSSAGRAHTAARCNQLSQAGLASP